MNQKSENGFTLVEYVIASAIIGLVSMGAYKMLFAPYKMTQMLDRARQEQLAYQMLDIIVADLQKADISSFAFNQLNQNFANGPLGMLPDGPPPAWIIQTNMQADPPYTFLHYTFVPTTGNLGNLVRYVANVATYAGGTMVGPTTLGAAQSSSIPVNSIAIPGGALPEPIPTATPLVAPPLLSVDPNNSNTLLIQIVFEPIGVKAADGHQAVFYALRRAVLRS